MRCKSIKREFVRRSRSLWGRQERGVCLVIQVQLISFCSTHTDAGLVRGMGGWRVYGEAREDRSMVNLAQTGSATRILNEREKNGCCSVVWCVV